MSVSVKTDLNEVIEMLGSEKKSNKKRGRGRPKGSKNKVTIQKEKTQKIEKEKMAKFDVNKRFDMLRKLVTMIGTGSSKSLIVSGAAGVGKTYNVRKTLEDCGLREDEEFIVVKGSSTAKGLYRVLHDNADKIIVFDDCDSVFKDHDGMNILKGALDSYDRRVIHWLADLRKNDKLSRSFEFKGKIVFITNISDKKLNSALTSRSLVVDFTMTNEEKLSRMKTIIEEILPKTPMVVKKTALDFVTKNIDRPRELSLRTLMKVVDVINDNPKDWEDLAYYSMLY